MVRRQKALADKDVVESRKKKEADERRRAEKRAAALAKKNVQYPFRDIFLGGWEGVHGQHKNCVGVFWKGKWELLLINVDSAKL